MQDLLSRYQRALSHQARRDQWRELPKNQVEDQAGNQQTPLPLLSFAHNDYLGLSSSSLVKDSLAEGAQLYGGGATGSRLLSGNREFILSFEAQIARDKGHDKALIFSTGFQANLTILSTLLNRKLLGDIPLVFADRLNHASLNLGCSLAGVSLHRYAHLDMTHLENLLKAHRLSSAPKFILTESLFGMDGDQANLGALCTLAQQYGAFLYVDDAHATGAKGFGLTLGYPVDGVLGTFSKGMGLAGAYFATHQTIYDLLVNFCPGFIYSTAPPLCVIYAAQKVWQALPHMMAQRAHLDRLCQQMNTWCEKQGYTPSPSYIFPFLFSDPLQSQKTLEGLLSRGIVVSLVRPPTVPQGKSRLRIALTAAHSHEEIHRLISALEELSEMYSGTLFRLF